MDQLTCTEHALLKSTLQKETLHEIQRKHNIASGLSHKALDESLVNLETHENMNIHGQELYHYNREKNKPFYP